MKLHIWTDRVSYLAIAHANNVAAARKLILETSDLGESGDGSCPERDRTRGTILGETPSIYCGEIAEFSLSDSAALREQEEHSETLRQQIAAKDRRIAELEAALMRLWPALDIQEVLAGNHEALDAAIAAAKREALEAAASSWEKRPWRSYYKPDGIARGLRRMAREVKP